MTIYYKLSLTTYCQKIKNKVCCLKNFLQLCIMWEARFNLSINKYCRNTRAQN